MSSKKSKTETKYTMEEVAKHTDPARSVWIVVNGNVLDVTKFVGDHPGGQEVLLNYAGKDASDVFDGIHSTKAKELAKSFIIGKLAVPQANTKQSNKP